MRLDLNYSGKERQKLFTFLENSAAIEATGTYSAPTSFSYTPATTEDVNIQQMLITLAALAVHSDTYGGCSILQGVKIRTKDASGNTLTDISYTNPIKTVAQYGSIGEIKPIISGTSVSSVQIVVDFNKDNQQRQGLRLDGSQSQSLEVVLNDTYTPLTSHRFAIIGDKNVQSAISLPNNTIIFNSNQGSGTTLCQHMSDGSTTNLRINIFARPGYTFNGWNTAANGTGTAYTDQAAYTMNNTNTDVILYAQWSLATYSITYNLNGGSNAGGNPATYNTTSDITFLAPTKTGYTFAGWYSNAMYFGVLPEIVPGSTGDVSVYAKWVANSDTITFNANGGTGTLSQSMTTGNAHPLTLNTLTYTGYTFAGWNTLANGTGTVYADGAVYTMGTGNVTLYAQWTIVTYGITYTLNGGTNNGSNPATYQVTTSTITLAAPTKSGSTFDAWYSDAGFTTPVTTIPLGSTGAIGVYAKFTLNNSVSFDHNGGVGTMTAQVIEDGHSALLTPNTFTFTLHTFNGWNTAANGSGTAYADHTSFLMGTSGVTLYAQWV